MKNTHVFDVGVSQQTQDAFDHAFEKVMNESKNVGMFGDSDPNKRFSIIKYLKQLPNIYGRTQFAICSISLALCILIVAFAWATYGWKIGLVIWVVASVIGYIPVHFWLKRHAGDLLLRVSDAMFNSFVDC
jgi:hypothetical protein